MATKTKKLKKLPEKLWKLIELAVKDLAAAEKAPNVIVDMCIWHSGDQAPEMYAVSGDKLVIEGPQDKCHVCLAGSVIRGMGVPDFMYASPDDFNDDIANKLYSLDSIRDGQLEEALYSFYNSDGAVFEDSLDSELTHVELTKTYKPKLLPASFKIVVYNKKNAAKFKEQLLLAAQLLKRFNL